MLKAIKLSLDQIDELIRLTANKTKLPVAMVEKDFWVSYMLEYLFKRVYLKDKLEFKGGTSLSKGYDLINRFSEDIDLVLHISTLVDESDLKKERSKTKQDIFNKQLVKKANEFIEFHLLPIIVSDISKELKHQHSFNYDKNENVIIFNYPQKYKDISLRQGIKLEIGVLAAWTPYENVNICSFVAKYYKNFFENEMFNVRVTAPKRTFWEKIIILHKEAHRTNQLPLRYSRHYYDIYQMLNSRIKEEALEDIELLEEVVRFNQKYYPTGWASFETAKLGTFKFIPQIETINIIRKDYESMRIMLYNKIPVFDEIIKVIKDFELEINNL